MYGLCKVDKCSVDNCPPFPPILSAVDTRTNKLAKFLIPNLKSLTSNEYTLKDLFDFSEKFCEFFIGSLDIESLFTNIPFEEINGI